MRRKFDFGKTSYKNKYYEKGVRLWERCSNRESKFYHEKEDALWLWQEENSTMTKKVYYEKLGSCLSHTCLWSQGADSPARSFEGPEGGHFSVCFCAVEAWKARQQGHRASVSREITPFSRIDFDKI